jgi:predicted PurR-regulated permease PerM
MEPSARFMARLAGVVVVIVGCYLVLSPFIPALLFAAVACSASWSLNLRLRAAVGGRTVIAALLMTLMLCVIVILPTALLTTTLTRNIGVLVNELQSWMDRGIPPAPAWLKSVPIAGEALDEYWHRLAGSREEVMTLLKSLVEPMSTPAVEVVKAVGAGLLHMLVAAFVAFFFYCDGEAIVATIRAILSRLAGSLGDEILDTIASTVSGVVVGIFGTALAQAAAATLGFLIAGVPMFHLLGAATFFLSILPIGPPLVWGGATIWLFYQDSIGWAIFMAAYGTFVISSIDNFLKPWLISRRSSLPMLLIVFGVFGGIAAFGFIGIFIGPPVLAVGFTLTNLWTRRPHHGDGTPS